MLRQIILFMIVLLNLNISSTYSQVSKTIPLPELNNFVYYFNSIDTSLSKLDQKLVVPKTSLGLKQIAGISAHRIVYSVNGKTSSIHISQSDSISFVIRLGEGNQMALASLKLFKANVRGSKRIAEFEEANFIGAKKNKDYTILYEIKELGENCYQLIPPTSLTKGEYFFYYPTGFGDSFAFCFSID